MLLYHNSLGGAWRIFSRPLYPPWPSGIGLKLVGTLVVANTKNSAISRVFSKESGYPRIASATQP